MKKTTKVAIVIGGLALILGVGMVSGIMPMVDPPYTFISNLI